MLDFNVKLRIMAFIWLVPPSCITLSVTFRSFFIVWWSLKRGCAQWGLGLSIRLVAQVRRTTWKGLPSSTDRTCIHPPIWLFFFLSCLPSVVISLSQQYAQFLAVSAHISSPLSACLPMCFPLCAVGSIAKRLSALTFTCILPSPYCILKGK